MLRARRAVAGGFTLLEMLVAMVIFAILVLLTVPAMATWIRNSKVRTVADNIQNGLRLAQAESLRRSRQVVFSMTNTSAPQNGFSAVSGGSYWSINVIPSMKDGTDLATENAFVEAGVLSAGGSTGITITGPAEVCFNSIGHVVANAATGVPGANCALPAGNPPYTSYVVNLQGADRSMTVMVALGGQVHLCTTNTVLSAANPDGCPP